MLNLAVHGIRVHLLVQIQYVLILVQKLLAMLILWFRVDVPGTQVQLLVEPKYVPILLQNLLVLLLL